MSIFTRFSEEIRRSRKEMHLTQEEAAAGLGISSRWFQELERGKGLPSIELALKIIAFFGIDGNTLRGEEYVQV